LTPANLTSRGWPPRKSIDSPFGRIITSLSEANLPLVAGCIRDNLCDGFVGHDPSASPQPTYCVCWCRYVTAYLTESLHMFYEEAAGNEKSKVLLLSLSLSLSLSSYFLSILQNTAWTWAGVSFLRTLKAQEQQGWGGKKRGKRAHRGAVKFVCDSIPRRGNYPNWVASCVCFPCPKCKKLRARASSRLNRIIGKYATLASQLLSLALALRPTLTYPSCLFNPRMLHHLENKKKSFITLPIIPISLLNFLLKIQWNRHKSLEPAPVRKLR